MFEGITWGQFSLFVLIAVIIYYIIVVAMYYRAEVLGIFSKDKRATELVTAPVQAFSAVGITSDYGNSMPTITGSGTPDINKPNSPDDKPGESEKPNNAENEPEESERFEVQDQEEEDPEQDCMVGEGFQQDEDLLFEDEVDLEEQFTSFDDSDSIEVETGGIYVNDLSRTVELLTQEEITISEKGELSKNLELIDDTLLLQSLLSGNLRAKEKLDFLIGDRLYEAEEEETVKGEQVIKDSFADVDVTKLIKQNNNF